MNSVPSKEDVGDGNYEYRPYPAKPPPPTPSQAFIHWLHYCDLDKKSNKRIWFDRLPKKLKEPLLGATESMPVAWGMYVREGADIAAMLWTTIILIIFSLGLLAAYIVCTSNVQNATGVGSIALTVVGLLRMCVRVDMGLNR